MILLPPPPSSDDNVPDQEKQTFSGRIQNFFKTYKDEITGGGVFVTLTTAAWCLLTPWAAVPLTLGGAFAGICVAGKEEFKKPPVTPLSGVAFIVGAITAVGIVVSGVINEFVSPRDGDTNASAITDKLNQECWSPGKTISFKPSSTNYTITIDSINSNSVISVQENKQTHTASATARNNFTGFWRGDTLTNEQPIDGAERSGFWRPNGDSIVKGDRTASLACK